MKILILWVSVIYDFFSVTGKGIKLKLRWNVKASVPCRFEKIELPSQRIHKIWSFMSHILYGHVFVNLRDL